MIASKTPLTDSKAWHEGVLPHPCNMELVKASDCRAIEYRLNECVDALKDASLVLKAYGSSLITIDTAIANARKPL